MSGSLYTPLGSGLIATLRRGDDVQTLHFGGETAREALSSIVEHCDAGGWRVACISAPSTILRDLAGSREYRSGGAEHEPRGRDGYGVATPERLMLAQVRRLDLLT